ncbi:unnamed protein product [Paramecium sonneborni]|uniref:C2H2-type domain-containing protein n=1 Tax=Paramecium sonneborni TaxID=65129 RepID=A0A8S1QV75_9CILI|nr:unnamed protein product [Paramecium sonneborni]
MQDRSRIIEMKQLLKLLQQINQLQIQNEESEKQNNKDSYHNDQQIINDIQIILNLEDDNNQQTEKDDKLSEKETISNKQFYQTSKQNLIELRKTDRQVIFNTNNHSYGCQICQIDYKLLKNLLNHQYRFHYKTKKTKNLIYKSIS